MGEHSDGWSLMGVDGKDCSAGRFSIHSAMASFIEGCLCWAKELWQGLWAGGDEARAWSSSWHHEPGQTGPEAGLVSPPSWLSAEDT